MAAEVSLQPVNESGWRMGFANMLRKENGAWWRTRSWLVQTIIWLAILNGILATVLFVADEASVRVEGANDQQAAIQQLMQDKPTEGLFLFVVMAGIAPAIGAVIVGQEAILDEKRSGTAAWVLSKPVSRAAFVLSKLVADSFGILVTAVVIQGVIAYALLSAAGGTFSVGSFAGALGVIFINLMFYLTLTLMLGTLFNGRGGVIAIPLGILFAYQFILGLVPGLASITPWALITNTPLSSTPLAVMVAQGQALPTLTPIIATVVWCVIFVVVALWRFNREEF